MQVLIVDDDNLPRITISRVLTKIGHTPVVFDDGLKLMEAVENNENLPLVWIVDWMMPSISGLEICEIIRNKHLEKYIYIILLTSNQGKEDMIQGFEAGADDYLVKPCDPEELRVRLAVAERFVHLQETVRESGERLELALKGGEMGLWDWDICSDTICFNDIWFEMMGLAKKEAPENFAEFLELVHPDDQQKLNEALEEHVEKREMVFRVEVRMLTGELIWRWFAISGKASINEHDNRPYRMTGTQLDIDKRKGREAKLVRLAAVVEQTVESIVITDVMGNIEYVNPAFESQTGYRRSEVLGVNPRILKSGKQDRKFYEEMWRALIAGEQWRGGMINKKKDGTLYEEEGAIIPVKGDNGDVVCFAAICRDITYENQLKNELAQAQKMESVGQLTAGVAHEINSPSQYVGDNLNFLKGSIEDIAPVLKSVYEVSQSEDKLMTAELLKQIDDIDLEFILDELATSIDDAIDGINRVSKIVRSMREFSHPGEKGVYSKSDLNRGIESAVTVSRNEWKYSADLKLELQEDLPLVNCCLDEINQVVLNLIVNASHAIADVVGGDGQVLGEIIVSSKEDGGDVIIEISDTGGGIPDEILEKIFDPFFTTKEVGRGTGQGLYIAHAIIEKHGGKISIETVAGKGTTFFIRLPIEGTGPKD